MRLQNASAGGKQDGTIGQRLDTVTGGSGSYICGGPTAARHFPIFAWTMIQAAPAWIVLAPQCIRRQILTEFFGSSSSQTRSNPSAMRGLIPRVLFLS